MSLPREAKIATVLPSKVADIASLIWHSSLSDSLAKRKTRHRSSGLYSRTASYAAFFSPALAFAQRARCAAAILLRPAAEIVRLGFDPFRAIAHRFFCARLIRFRAEADNVRCPFKLELPNAASAAVNRWTSCCALFNSFFNCPATPDKFPLVLPRQGIETYGLGLLCDWSAI